MAVGRGSIMRAAKAGSKKEKSIEFMTQATESQVEEKSMAEEKQDVKETAAVPADDQSAKAGANEPIVAIESETKSEAAAVEKPVKKTTRRKTAAKAVKKVEVEAEAAAKTKAPARAKKETIDEIKVVEEVKDTIVKDTIVEEPVKSASKNYVGIKDKMPTYLL